MSTTAQATLARLDPEAPRDYRELAVLLACEWAEDPPGVVGLAGGQGAGKSTLSRLIAAAGSELDLRICVLGLDDFYHPRSVRQELARRVHPLLETRGPPGTHDLAMCCEAMTQLRQAQEVKLPIFEKGVDDRRGHRIVRGPFDVVLLEGWCVGAPPEAPGALEKPINDLEASQDPDGTWRRFVNDQLEGAYALTWRLLESLVYLRVPSVAAIRRWRLQQESERPIEQRMDAAQIDRFVQHYERTTLSMDRTLPGMADWLVTLSEDHSVSALTF